MNNYFSSLIALSTGIALGTLFFGGLWLTVKKTMTSRVPAMWLLASFLIRSGITVTGFYFIVGLNWQNLLISLFGFVMARYFIQSLTKPKPEHQRLSINETES